MQIKFRAFPAGAIALLIAYSCLQVEASPTVLSSACGSDNKQPFASLASGSANLCSSGNTVGNFKTVTGGWSWSCQAPSSVPSASCAANLITAKVVVDFDSPTAIEVAPEAFGANIVLLNQWQMSDTTYQQVMKAMDWPFLRVNGQKYLLGTTFPSRDAATGKAAPDWTTVDLLANNLSKFFSGKLMITIGDPPRATTYPGWSSQPFDVSDSGDQALYADMAAQISEYLIKKGVHVTYWSTLNEPNIPANKATGALSYNQQVDATCAVVNATAEKLKAIDPTYIVGGPDLDYWGSNTDWLYSFASCASRSAGFLSYHTYGTSSTAPDNVQALLKGILSSNAYNRTYLAGAAHVVEAARSVSSTWPVMLTEYNMNGAADPSDPNQRTVAGAVYDALATTQAIQGGASAIAIWEAFGDSNFGVIDNQYVIHPAAYLLNAMRQSLPGQLVTSTINPALPKGIVHAKVFATETASGGYAVLLVNYDQTNPIYVQVDLKGKQVGTTINQYTLSDQSPDGLAVAAPGATLDDLVVAPNSVVILTPDEN